MTIDQNALETLVRTQGILLEHQTFDAFCKRFGAQIYDYFINQVSLRDFIPENREIEIDVYYEHYEQTSRLDVQFLREYQGQFGERKIATDGYGIDHPHIMTSIVTECKGHPSDGFLLCRNVVTAKEKTRQNFSSPPFNNGGWKTYFADQNNNTLVDWAFFYKAKVEGQKDKKNTIYFEDRDKTYSAFKQITSGVEYAWERIKALRSKTEGVNSRLFRILPILVTNARICMMTIQDGKAAFKLSPWATYINNIQDDDGTKQINDSLKFLYIVNFENLNSFLDRYIDPKNSLDIPSDFKSETDFTIDLVN